MAGFEVTINGRFWVTAEGDKARALLTRPEFRGHNTKFFTTGAETNW
jgi:hypothetical protein